MQVFIYIKRTMEPAHNIAVFLFALMPIVLYINAFYYVLPPNFVSIHRSRRYLVSGLMSPFLIFLVYFMIPGWGNPINLTEIWKYLFFAIFQIGLLEEWCKYVVFQWVTLERISARNDLPVAIAVYSIMISLGFALTENMGYVISLYRFNVEYTLMAPAEIENSLVKLIILRSVTATVMHMVCGLIIGYFISRSNNDKIKISFGGLDYVSKELRFPKLTHLAIGIGLASLFHGIYDFNLLLPDNDHKTSITVMILISGIAFGYLIMKRLIKESSEIRYNKLN